MLRELLLAAAVLYLGFAAVVFLLADRLIFLPPSSSYSARDLPITTVQAEDGVRLAVLHLPNPEAEHTILFSHGNAEDLGHLAPFLEEMRRAGFGIIAFDYRGYGESTGGPPTARGAARDLAAVYRHAVQELEIPPERLILHGRSVGSGPATQLAAREPVAGLILESAFVSAFRVVTRVQVLPFDRFPNLRHLPRVRAPVLVIHGSEDEVVPPSHARRLYAAAPGPKQLLWVEGAGHNDLMYVAGERYVQALREFGRMVREAERESGGR